MTPFFRNAIKQSTETLSEHMHNYQARIHELELDLKANNETLHTTQQRCETLEKRISALEDYSRKDNLIFDGVEESAKENCMAKVKDILKQKLDIADAESIVFQRLHRLHYGPAPRPIMCRFLNYNERQRVWTARNRLKGTNIYLREDFSSDVMAERRILAPILKRARETGHKAFLQKNHLVINDHHYTVQTLSTLPTKLQPENVATRKVGSGLTGFFIGASPLSNFLKTKFELVGRTFSSVEQFLQYTKAIFADKPDAARNILEAGTPAACKAIGDKTRVDNDDWLAVARKDVERACEAKFLQNDCAREFFSRLEIIFLLKPAKIQCGVLDLHLIIRILATRRSGLVKTCWASF